MKSRVALWFTTVVLLIVGVVGCGSTEKLSSVWNSKTILIDGDSREWTGVAFHKVRTDVQMAVTNDDEYAYVCILSRDRVLHMLLMRAGFTVWFDPAGGKEKTFGVNFPVRGGAPMMSEAGEGENPGMRRRPLEDLPMEMDIVGPGEKDRYRVSPAEDTGIQTRIGRNEDGTMVYELRVPLQKSKEHQFAIGVSDRSQPVGVGLETGEFSKENMRRPPDREGRGEGFGGGGMSRPEGRGEGGSGGPPGGMRPGREQGGARPDPLDSWYQVQLGQK